MVVRVWGGRGAENREYRWYCRPFCRYSPDTKVGGQLHEHGLWSYGDDKGRQNSYEAGKFSIQVT